MFGIGLTEIILIVVLALLILGPEKFPDMAKKAGKVFAQFQRMGREFKNTVANLDTDETKEHPPKKEEGEPKVDSLDDLSPEGDSLNDLSPKVDSLDDLSDEETNGDGGDKDA